MATPGGRIRPGARHHVADTKSARGSEGAATGAGTGTGCARPDGAATSANEGCETHVLLSIDHDLSLISPVGRTGTAELYAPG
jgi:hypothetical protein